MKKIIAFTTIFATVAYGPSSPLKSSGFSVLGGVLSSVFLDQFFPKAHTALRKTAILVAMTLPYFYAQNLSYIKLAEAIHFSMIGLLLRNILTDYVRKHYGKQKGKLVENVTTLGTVMGAISILPLPSPVYAYLFDKITSPFNKLFGYTDVFFSCNSIYLGKVSILNADFDQKRYEDFETKCNLHALNF